MVADYERKILAKEGQWQLARKTLGKKISLNTWKSNNGTIEISIFQYDTPKEALQFLEGSKWSRASGHSVDVKELGDAAYEHLTSEGVVCSIMFVKGRTVVMVDTLEMQEIGLPVARRFAKHVLDAMQGQ